MLGAAKLAMVPSQGLYTPPWANVIFLAHLDESAGSTAFTDKKGATISNPSSAVATTGAPTQFGKPTASFNGTNARLSTPATAAWAWTGNYTIEFWIMFNVVTGTPDIIGNFSADVTGEWMVLRSGNRLQWYPNTSAQFCSSTQTLVAGQWYYVRCVRSNNVCTMFVDDVASNQLTLTGTHGSASKPINFGCRAGASGFLNGYLAQIRVCNVAIPKQGIPTGPWPDA